MDRFHGGRLLNSCGCECFTLGEERGVFSLLVHYCGTDGPFHYSYAEFLKKAKRPDV